MAGRQELHKVVSILWERDGRVPTPHGLSQRLNMLHVTWHAGAAYEGIPSRFVAIEPYRSPLRAVGMTGVI
jgi:hypothetical protein